MTGDTDGPVGARGDDALLSVDQALALAMRLHREGRLEDADTLYGRILEAAPDHADALHYSAILCHQRHRPAEAERRLRRVVALVPEHAGAWNNLGNVLEDAGRREEAREAYLRVVELDPGHADAWNNLGVLHRRERRYEEAETALQRAVVLDPKLLDARYNLAGVLSARGKHEEAVELLRLVISENPRYHEARKRLGQVLRTMGRKEEAAEVYREWLAVSPDHPVARHMLAACTGDDVPTRATDAYVRALFDGFSGSFDEHLAGLDYQVPEAVAGALAARVEPRGDLDILDAGCGTGLCGPLLRPHARTLTGVDLSPGMLARARVRDCYDELAEAELTAWLAERTAAFNVIVVADTLVYFGALEEVFGAARNALREGGLLLFTVERAGETGDGTGFAISRSGRYRHDEDYVRRTLGDAGLEVLSVENLDLRCEGGEPVAGLLFTAGK